MKSFPRNILEQAQIACNGWEKLGELLQVPSLTFDEYISILEQAKQKIEDARELQRKRAEAITVRDETLAELWVFTKRIRNAAKAVFGDDSEQVAMVGSVPVNTRRSRKALKE